MAKKPTPAAAPLAEGSYRSTGTVLHNGESYAPGQIIADLTEAEASALLTAGVVEASAAPPEPAPPET